MKDLVALKDIAALGVVNAQRLTISLTNQAEALYMLQN